MQIPELQKLLYVPSTLCCDAHVETSLLSIILLTPEFLNSLGKAKWHHIVGTEIRNGIPNKAAVRNNTQISILNNKQKFDHIDK